MLGYSIANFIIKVAVRMSGCQTWEQFPTMTAGQFLEATGLSIFDMGNMVCGDTVSAHVSSIRDMGNGYGSWRNPGDKPLEFRFVAMEGSDRNFTSEWKAVFGNKISDSDKELFFSRKAPGDTDSF